MTAQLLDKCPKILRRHGGTEFRDALGNRLLRSPSERGATFWIPVLILPFLLVSHALVTQ